jgi:hypothetical protein
LLKAIAGAARAQTRSWLALSVLSCFCIFSYTQYTRPLDDLADVHASAVSVHHPRLARHALEEVSPRGPDLPALPIAARVLLLPTVIALLNRLRRVETEAAVRPDPGARMRRRLLPRLADDPVPL